MIMEWSGLPKYWTYMSCFLSLCLEKVVDDNWEWKAESRINNHGELRLSDVSLRGQGAIVISLDDVIHFLIEVGDSRASSLGNLEKASNIISIKFVSSGSALKFNESFAHLFVFLGSYLINYEFLNARLGFKKGKMFTGLMVEAPLSKPSGLTLILLT